LERPPEQMRPKVHHFKVIFVLKKAWGLEVKKKAVRQERKWTITNSRQKRMGLISNGSSSLFWGEMGIYEGN